MVSVINALRAEHVNMERLLDVLEHQLDTFKGGGGGGEKVLDGHRNN